MPAEAIRLTTYDQLDLYLSKSTAGDLGLVLLLLLGRQGAAGGNRSSAARVRRR